MMSVTVSPMTIMSVFLGNSPVFALLCCNRLWKGSYGKRHSKWHPVTAWEGLNFIATMWSWDWISTLSNFQDLALVNTLIGVHSALTFTQLRAVGDSTPLSDGNKRMTCAFPVSFGNASRQVVWWNWAWKVQLSSYYTICNSEKKWTCIITSGSQLQTVLMRSQNCSHRTFPRAM